MKKIFFALVTIFITICSIAQKNSDIHFNVGGELGFATGNFGDVYSVGLGATAQLEYAVNTKTNITVNSGIIDYFGKKVPGTTLKIQNTVAIPIIGGVKYYFADNFYGAAQVGFSIFSGAGQTSKFTYSPGIGFKINDKYDALLKYTGYSNAGGAFGVRVSYAL